MQSNIRKLRNERNISQTTLAEVLGKTQQTISHMERDRDRISIESLIALSEYFGVSTDCILGIESGEDRSEPHAFEDKAPQVKKESEKSSTGGNKKILYQLILTLLLDSMDDDTQSVIAALGSHV